VVGYINPKTVESHGKALLVLLRIDESYRKLVGADADERIKVEATVSNTKTPQEEALMDMIRKVQRENQQTMKDMKGDQ
jgi:tRNA A37 threonylcarbamoyladenosine modification protein TsaB